MPDGKTPRHARLLALLLTFAAIAGVAAALVFSQRLSSGPEPIAWNNEACAHCRMHIGDKAFAAQLQLEDGRVQSFDDPGCAFRALAAVKPEEVHAVWFRHSSQDRWVSGQQARFVPMTGTPMGYGLGAVEAGVEGSLSLAEAMKQVLGGAREEALHGAAR